MEKPLIEADTTIDADARQVWRALTASKSAMFMGAEVDSDWKEGSPISFTGEFKGKAYRDHGEIRTVDKGRELAFTHFYLQPMDGPVRESNTRDALRYCLEHPRWRLSLQTHKILGIP